MTLQDLVSFGVLPLLAVSFALTASRVLRGPTAADRVVALDTLAVVGLCVAASLSVLTGERALGDVVLVIALVCFLGTVAWARYLERWR